MKSDKSPGSQTQGLQTRRAAARLLAEVMVRRRPLTEALAASYASGALAQLPERDGALARLIVFITLRRLGQIDDVIGHFLKKKLPRKSGQCLQILQISAAQLLFLSIAPHAVVDLGVSLAAKDPHARHLKSLVNAVLRRMAQEGPAIVKNQDAARINTPEWLWQSWAAAYGEDTARQIADIHLDEAPLDITPLRNPEHWAKALGGEVFLTRSVRLQKPGQISMLEGFAEGNWWVQDAAAALPVRLLGDVKGLEIADLCAAPGGKTMQLIAGGARVSAVDLSARRMKRLEENLRRLEMKAELVTCDVLAWEPQKRFDAILLDAPCSSTGTIRRHPDILRLKTPQNIEALISLQDKMLRHSAELLKPGGKLVYCVCSLQAGEGEPRIEAFLAANKQMRRKNISPEDFKYIAQAITPDGDLRVLPSMFTDQGGVDGFYAAILVKEA